MRLLLIVLLACFSLAACGKKADLKTPPLPGEQQEKEDADRAK